MGTFTCNLRFPGQVFDGQAGLHHNYSGDCYDPATGHYCGPDPIGLKGGIDPYAYVDASPIMWVDPTGDETIPLPSAIPLPGWVGSASAVVGAGVAGWEIGSAIYPHIAIPLGDAIGSVGRANEKSKEREWEDAYRQCRRMLSGRVLREV